VAVWWSRTQQVLIHVMCRARCMVGLAEFGRTMGF
jgi:hypothetical protein